MMSEFINTSTVIGDDALVDSILDGTITEYKENRVNYIGGCAFRNCTALEIVDAPNIKSIQGNALDGCTAITALILRGETVCTLTHANALTGTPIASGTGYIYIPAVLKDSYAAATNWSTYAAQFRDLESFTVDGTVDGELDETKI